MEEDEEDEDDDEDNEHGIKDDDNRLKIPTSLPTFSKKIQQCLIDGDFWITDTSRIQFTSEMAVFYHTNNILLTNSKHYKAVCMTVLAKYENFKYSMSKLCDNENKNRLNRDKKMKTIQPWVNRL